MARVTLTILIVAVVGAAGYVFWNYRIDAQYNQGNLVSVRLTRRSDAGAAAGQSVAALPATGQPVLRIGTFHVDQFDDRKLANRRINEILMQLLPQFELIALQGLRGPNLTVVARLTEQVSQAAGRPYDYAAKLPRSGRADEEYVAFLFDRTALEIDRTSERAIDEASGRFRAPPLAALFRARGPKSSDAFTFQAINVCIDPRSATEAELLGDVFRVVRDDGRNEDDILLLGDLGIEDTRNASLHGILDLTAVVQNLPTTVRGTRRVDNILFLRRATSEFTGRSDVVDLPRAFELPPEAAADVSEHLPVWAEFSVLEGGQPGHVTTASIQ